MRPQRALLTLAVILAIPLGSCDRSAPTENSFSSSDKIQAGLTGDRGRQFTDQFRLEDCTFSSVGQNPFFPLVPGSVSVFRAVVEGVKDSLEITTLDETLVIDGVETRIVEERDFEDDELIEVSRNYFAHCAPNNSVFYFGEDVDNYQDGKIINHDGTWRHGVNGARAGLQMAGLPLLGSRYFQEIAPGVALDQAETVKLDARTETPFRLFTSVLVNRETTALDPDAVEFKWYAAGVGLIKDAEMPLIAHH